MQVRLAHRYDFGSILNIYKYYVDNTVITFDLTLPSSSSYFQKMEEAHVFLVLETAGKVIGYAYAGPHRQKPAYQWVCESTIYLHPENTSQGYGKRLYSALFELLENMNLIRVLAGVTIPNPKSIRFHEKVGFKSMFTYKDIGYKNGQWHSVVWYEMYLKSADLEKPRSIVPLADLDREIIDGILDDHSK